jgi:Protein of unknown function (DUF3037)
MTERTPCEFFLIRYVPDVVKGEFVNIGVLLREAAGGHPGTQVRFTRDWARVRCLDADADTRLLEGLEHEIAERLRIGISPRDPKAVFDVLNDTLSNSVQMSEGRATLAENLPTEMELLLRMYVEPMKVAKIRLKSGRAAIAATMRREFERTGAWPLMRKRIAASAYTRPGDPLKLDCGYRAVQPDGPVRIFQAVSLDSDAEAAKVLAYSAPQLGEGVRRVEGTGLELTAVVEALREVTDDPDSETGERYRFGIEAMERQAIRVITLNDLARAAITAQRELGL